MPAPWEEIPIIGPMFGHVADGILDGAIQLGEHAVNAAGAISDVMIGKERTEKAVTTVPARLVANHADKNELTKTATETVKGADDGPLAQLSGQVLRRWRPLQDGAKEMVEMANSEELESIILCVWSLVISIIDKVNPGRLLKALPELPRLMLEKTLGTVGRLGVIRGGILSNEVNVATLGLLWNNFDALVRFFVDLAECAKCYGPASSLDGRAVPDEPHGSYNELDLTQPMNRHGVVCQIQRLIKSVVFILESAALPVKFEDIDMTKETVLPSDDCDLGTLIEVRPSGWHRLVEPGMPQRPWIRLPLASSPPASASPAGGAKPSDNAPKITREKWFFINGIATELFWLHLACGKLAERYSREITGIFNRSEGMLWDLIECGGERDARGVASRGSQSAATKRTRSSRAAQMKLKEQLKAALRQAGEGKPYDHVVVIAHSQGCLLLRLALEELILSAGKESGLAGDIRRPMIERLCVFTFGSPSVDWRLGRDEHGGFPPPLPGTKQEKAGVDLGFLSSHVLCTEHFANKADSVAKLGILNKQKDKRNSGYEADSVFVNCEEGWVGHLFGTQYSLDPSHYGAEERPDGVIVGETAQMAGFRSVLLRCKDGVSIQEAMAKKVNAGQEQLNGIL